MSGRRVSVLHGVNLDQLGRRPPEHYPAVTLAELEVAIGRFARELGITITFDQTNNEGEYCEALHEAAETADALLLNPGAWTHYSYAIRDALEIAALPAVEVHLSAVDEREEWRRHSVIADLCVGRVSGKGVDGYREGLEILSGRLGAAVSTRADRLAQAVGEKGLDALLITNLPNLRWATGFTGSNGAAVIGPDVRVFFTDFRYVEQAAEQVPDFERQRAGRDLLADVAARLQGRTGFEDHSLSVRAHGRLKDAAGGAVELVGASGIVETLREVKEPHELETMRAAAAIADQAYAELAEAGIGGRTEKQIAAALEVRMRELGAEDRSFPAIVASGGHGALPHAVPRDVAVERDTFMIVDMGCVVDGYCSDCTRTFATGSVSDDALAVYELVAEAQLAGLAAVRAGADCRGVDTVARDIIDGAGHGEHYGHGLGHGVGLEVHEGPRLAQTASGTLRAGNTVSVEPGVYLPGKLGVRIEDLVAVTGDGCDILTGFTKDLVTLS